MDALVVPLQVCFSDELLATVILHAGEGVFSLFVMGLHMGFEVIAATKELPAALHFALEVGFLARR
jgi:hypothetical protein